MNMDHPFRLLTDLLSFKQVQRARRRRNHRHSFRFGSAANLERLEDRVLLASVTLTDVIDSSLGSSAEAKISGDGTKVVFSSNANPTGENHEGNMEIFLFDVGSSSLTQMTDAESSSYSVSFQPSINGDGTRIAFSSEVDFVVTDAEGGGIFIFDTISGNFGGVSTDGYAPTISSDGTKIAFTTYADLTGQNTDGNSELFLFDTTTSNLMQITNTTFPYPNVWGASINSDGTRIGLNARADLTGGNSDNDRESFLFDATTSTFTQLTDGGAFTAKISGDGTKIAIYSNANLTGQNPDGNLEIFLYDATTSTLTQVTDTTGGESRSPDISSDGTKIAFNSTADLTGDNGDGNREIFVFDLVSGGFIQVTDTTSGTFVWNGTPSIDGDGTRIVFTSDQHAMNGEARSGIVLATITYPLHGDYNNNGMVEQADLDLVLINWGQSFDALPDEWIDQRPTSGLVDQAELDAVLVNWGATDTSIEPAPEPAALAEARQIADSVEPGWSMDDNSGLYNRRHGMGYGEVGHGTGYHHDDLDDWRGFGDGHLAGERLHEARLRAQSAVRATHREELFASLRGENYPGLGHGMHAHAGDLNDAWHLPMPPVHAADGPTHDGWPPGHMLAPIEHAWASGICGDAPAHDEFFSSFGQWSGRKG